MDQSSILKQVRNQKKDVFYPAVLVFDVHGNILLKNFPLLFGINYNHFLLPIFSQFVIKNSDILSKIKYTDYCDLTCK